MNFLYLSLLVISLSGCLGLSSNNLKKESRARECFFHVSLKQRSSDCDIAPWVDYWMLVSQLTWEQRQSQLSSLTSLPSDRVKLILLSHVPNTPYQSRLRAQLVAQQFIQSRDDKLAEFIRTIVFEPAQERLELESALTTQIQFNIGQEKLLQTQTENLAEQAQQINKLLQIEKTLLKNHQQPTHE